MTHNDQLIRNSLVEDSYYGLVVPPQIFLLFSSNHFTSFGVIIVVINVVKLITLSAVFHFLNNDKLSSNIIYPSIRRN